MFDIGPGELVLVAIIGLLVLGPQRLPKVAAEIGKWVGRARRTATQLRRQLEREIEISEISDIEKSLTSTRSPTPTPPTPTPPTSTPISPPVAQSGDVPLGPGTHVDQPEAGTSAPSSAPEPRAEQTPPS